MTGKFISFNSINSGLNSETIDLVDKHLQGHRISTFISTSPSDGPIGVQAHCMASACEENIFTYTLIRVADFIDQYLNQYNGLLSKLGDNICILHSQYAFNLIHEQTSPKHFPWIKSISGQTKLPDISIFLDFSEEYLNGYINKTRSLSNVEQEALMAQYDTDRMKLLMASQFSQYLEIKTKVIRIEKENQKIGKIILSIVEEIVK